MDPLVLRPAAAYSHRRLSELLNQSYADYLAPVTFDPYQFGMMCEDMDVDLTRSVVAVARGDAVDWPADVPVGLALLSIRGAEGWVSGVGVLPEWRRRGIGRAMVQHIQQDALAGRITRVRLEVLSKNRPGIHLYRSLGFASVRDLLVLRRPSGAKSPIVQLGLDIRSVRPHNVLRWHNVFHEVDPSWQRALASLQKRATWVQARGLFAEGDLIGYVFFQERTDVVHVLDLAVAPDLSDRVALAETLLGSLHVDMPELGGYIVNMPEEDPLSRAFVSLEYRVELRQQEMAWLPSVQEPRTSLI